MASTSSKYATAYAKDTEPIHPGSIYPYQSFIRCGGVSKSKIREARLQGLVLKTFDTGRRKYVRGVDGIAFIEQLSKLQPPTPKDEKMDCKGTILEYLNRAAELEQRRNDAESERANYVRDAMAFNENYLKPGEEPIPIPTEWIRELE